MKLILILFIMTAIVVPTIHAITDDEIRQVNQSLIFASYQDINCTIDNSTSPNLIGEKIGISTPTAKPAVVGGGCFYNRTGAGGREGGVDYSPMNINTSINFTVVSWTNISKSPSDNDFDALISSNNDNSAGDWNFEFDERSGLEKTKCIYKDTVGYITASSGVDIGIFEGKWEMHVCVFNVTDSSSKITIQNYRNTTIKAEASGTGAFSSTNSNITIGDIRNGATNQEYTGDIDEVMIFNRSLTSVQIQYIYDQNNAGKHILFSPSIDSELPNIATTFNITNPVINDIINFSGNMTDNVGLMTANITYNMSGVITKVNFTLSGLSSQVSNSTKILTGGVFNFTLFVTDTNDNVIQNSTLITVPEIDIQMTKPLNMTVTHNNTFRFNYTVNSSNDFRMNVSLYADTNTDPTTLINSSINFSGGTWIVDYTFNTEILGSINGTYYWKVNATNNQSVDFTSDILTFNITNNVSAYNTTNVSLSPLPLEVSTQAKCHFNMTNKAGQTGDNITSYDLRWYINNTRLLEGGNNTLLNAPNVSLNANITCEVRLKTFLGETGWTVYVNSSVVTAGDSSAPILRGNRTSPTSVERDLTIDLFGNFTDNVAISSIKAEVTTSNSISTNYSMSLYSGTTASGEWKFTYTTSVTGTHTVKFYAQDGSSNLLNADGGLTFSVTAPPSGGDSGGGGGGGSSQSITVITGNQTPLLSFGVVALSFFVITTPRQQQKLLLFKNLGNADFTEGSIEILGDIKPFITAQVCDIEMKNCKTKDIDVKQGQSTFLVVDCNCENEIDLGKDGIIRLAGDKVFDLPVTLDRPPFYGIFVRPLLGFGLNHLMSYILGYGILVTLVFIIINTLVGGYS